MFAHHYLDKYVACLVLNASLLIIAQNDLYPLVSNALELILYGFMQKFYLLTFAYRIYTIHDC